ncbi:unnamed protein product [Auanema sp. JU1783]|nr:unnamed protein product [Auanema sp. JU1783]
MPEPTIAKNVSKISSQLKDGVKGLFPLFGLIAYTVLGAILFQELEYPYEKFTLETLQKDRAKLVEDTIFSLNTRPRGGAINDYNNTRRILLRYNEKLGLDEVDPEAQVRWSFWGSVFYCMTVYTTIGYGNIAPVTTGGRILTIIYAFLGIPLALIVLYSLGLIFARICRWLWKALIKSTKVVSKDLGQKVEDAVGIEEGQAKTAENDDDDLLSFPISFLIFVTVMWIFICAAIFLLFEEWDYGTSLYFTLISFTTIGFGDIVPSEFSYVVVVALLLLIGLSLVSTVLTLIQQQIQALASGMQENIDREYMNALAEAADEGEISDEDVRKMSSGDILKNPEDQKTKKTMDAVISRMPMKERVLYHIMPASAKKALEQSADSKSRRRTCACQTDMVLLEDLIKEELLKMELQSGSSIMDRSAGRMSEKTPITPTSPSGPSTSFVMPSRTTKFQSQNTEEEEVEDAPRAPVRSFKIEKVTPIEQSAEPSTITTTLIKEDDV